MKNKPFRQKIFTFSIGSFFVLTALILSLSLLIIYVGLHPERIGIRSNPDDLDLTYEDVLFHNMVDQTTLEGWWIPAQDELFKKKNSKDTIIFAHGFGGSRSAMPSNTLKLAKRLAYEGYNVLMFDFRNSGSSGGKFTTIGYYEKYDLLSAIEYAKSKDSSNIGLLGWSMGASASILAASESVDVKAVIADSPFSDFHTYIEEQFSYWTKLPDKLSPFVVSTAETVVGLDYEKVSPALASKKLQENEIALFLIHGKKDNAISYQNSLDIQQINSDASIWLTEDAGHIRSYKKEKEQYEDRIIQFFNTYLRKKSVPSMHAFSYFTLALV